MNKQGVTFKPEEVIKQSPKPVINSLSMRSLTSQLLNFNRPKCSCGKTKNPPYCDGSHAFK
jgi:CDGSH-type Zn-finger protein